MDILLDAFDEMFVPLVPPQRTIDEIHRAGLWHQTFACWLVNPAASTVFFQIRGPQNRIDPGSYDASASGHLEAGEKPQDGFREMEEELGINARNFETYFLGIYRNIAIRGGYINHEFCHVYLAKFNNENRDLVLQEGEVDGLAEFLIQDVIDLLLEKTISICPVSATYKHNEQKSSRAIGISNLCNWQERTQTSHYYLKVMLCAQEYISGKEIIVL